MSLLLNFEPFFLLGVFIFVLPHEFESRAKGPLFSSVSVRGRGALEPLSDLGLNTISCGKCCLRE